MTIYTRESQKLNITFPTKNMGFYSLFLVQIINLQHKYFQRKKLYGGKKGKFSKDKDDVFKYKK